MPEETRLSGGPRGGGPGGGPKEVSPNLERVGASRGGVKKGWGGRALKCARLEFSGCRVKPQGPGASKHQNSTKRDPQERKKLGAGEDVFAHLDDTYTVSGNARVGGAHVVVEEELLTRARTLASWEDASVEKRGHGAERHGGSDPGMLQR